MIQSRDVLITGGTGYVGRPPLLARGHRVRVLTREASAKRVPPGVVPVIGDALDAGSIAAALRPDDALVQLVGTPHPNPSKAAEFRAVDLTSVRAAVEAASRIGIRHLVYVSVAHPAPVMEAFITVRIEGECLVADARLTATILRPWYVLGPGHWWPLVLKPIYALASLVPSLRAGAERLGLVTLADMVAALVAAVETPLELSGLWACRAYAAHGDPAAPLLSQPVFGSPSSDSARTMVTTATTQAMLVVFAHRCPGAPATRAQEWWYRQNGSS